MVPISETLGPGPVNTPLFRMGVHQAVLSTAVLTVTALALAGCALDDPPPQNPGSQRQATAPAKQQPEGQQTVQAQPAARVGTQATQAPVQAASKPSPTPAPEPAVQDLIRQIEAAYSSGLQNYRDGKLQAAKTDFDRAVDLMLTGKFDVKNDPALSIEFDRIVDGVNALEMEALKQGNGFAPKIEPSPVDIANDVTFPVDPNLKAQAIAELKTTQSDLPLVINDPVAGYINYFSSRGRGTLERSLERAGRYHDLISRILVQEGVPQDLIYQAVAESGFQPQAVNARTGAGGMWQFMPFGPYGLERNGWFDERFDPQKSTVAYARYMKELYAQLGDWYLAMAAYDWGPGNVQRAVQRTGYADFWELYRRNVLPQETKNYVPIIIAAAIMAKNPQQYGLQSLSADPPLVTDVVTTNSSVDLQLVSDIVETPVQEILALNPSLLRMATPADIPFELHLPPGAKDLYEKRIAEIPQDKRSFWRFHKIVSGETLASIAHDYHVTPSEIAFVNQIQPEDDLSGADSLIIPVAPAPSLSRGASTRYRVQRGDTLVTVADRFNVTVQQLRRWNHLGTGKLQPGRSLYVAEPARVSRSRRSRQPKSSPSAQSSSLPSTRSSSASLNQ
jgi:membrane-bound lytic murein transglycosylase D